MSPPKDVLADARWLPSHLDAARAALTFFWLPRERHAQVPFLTDEYLQPLAPPSVELSLADARSIAGADTAGPHYIFHSAFCRSTLLARVLDIPGTSMGLKEPQLLNELAASARRHQLGEDMLRLTVRLLGRPFGPREAVVVKPSNAANLLAEPLLRADARSKAILLYAPLPRFLRSIASKGMWGRIWARRLFTTLRRDPSPEFGFSEAELFEQTDLQAAALAWLLHHSHFARLSSQFPDRIRTLDSETLLARKADCLAALARHLGLGLDERQCAELANSPIFAEHSKEIGRSFDPEDASMEPIPLIDEEIQMVASWTKAVAEHIGLSLDPPAEPLLA
jgi:hypothetical protein